MDGIWPVIGLALLPALGNFCGGLTAELTRATPSRLNWALHAAAGIVFAIVSVELIPEALKTISAWLLAAAFGVGGLAYLAIEQTVDRLQSDQSGTSGSGGASRAGMWMIYIAVSMDLFSDGLLIGAGSAVSIGMAVVLALGQVLADLPEGYATIANMKSKGVPRGKRILLSASFAVPVLGAAVASFYLLRDQNEAWKMAVLIFTAGLLTVAAAEEMLSEAHESVEDSRRSVLFFIGGFVLFTLVSAGFESVLSGAS